jgi:hypothetical protein
MCKYCIKYILPIVSTHATRFTITNLGKLSIIYVLQHFRNTDAKWCKIIQNDKQSSACQLFVYASKMSLITMNLIYNLGTFNYFYL